MPPASRFGASKYRNAVPYVPPREEYYRSSLPPFSTANSTSTSSALSTFSSEIKTDRQWIVTLTSAGELSYRGHTGAEGTIKVGTGGGVGDWDLSRLEDGLLAVGGLDGGIAVYALPSLSASPSALSLVRSILSSSSPVSNVAFHPTTPNLLLVSTTSSPLVVYDLTSTSPSPTITLNVKEPKGLWTTAWSSDGTKVAALGKSGTLYVFDPRSSPDPIVSKSLSFTIQALKPARILWMGEDIFLSSFSKSRNRQYSLISFQSSPAPSLETRFTQPLDTSPGILIPLVDEERRIVYLAGRGDMTLRQIELSGPQGYQETLHPLPYPIASASIALKHPTTLDVMNAEIAKILIPVVDKDGDAILPFGVRVPRRQLIDYHEDLYPDIVGTVPEQSAEEWLKGGDRRALPFTLDPARRNAWEDRIQQWLAVSNPTTGASIPSSSVQTQSASLPIEVSDQKPADSEAAPTADPTSTEPSSAPKSVPPVTVKNTLASPKASTVEATLNPKVPALAEGETYISTEYKCRITSDYLASELSRYRKEGNKGPLMVGLQGPQGCGKTTLCAGLVGYLEEKKGLKSAILSLDDLYKTHEGLVQVAQKHPDNALLAGRGPPGTHDVDLAISTLQKVQHINDSPNTTVDLPIFDKSLCGGEGDRSADTVKVTGPIDIFILEGWSMGFGPLSETELQAKHDDPKPASPETSKTYFHNQPLSSLAALNSYLSELSSAIYGSFSSFIQVEPVSYDYVFEWRLEQEHQMKSKNGGKGMTDDQVHRFVERYMPGYELWKEGIWAKGTGWEGRGLRLKYGKNREVIEVTQPSTTDSYAGEERLQDIQLPNVEPVATEIKSTPPVEVTKPTETDKLAEVVTPFPPPTPSSDGASSTSTAKLATSSQPGQPSAHAAVSTPAATSESAPFNPNWSRKFLAGKSPLIPSYDSTPSLASLHQDSKVLKANAHLACFPIQGTGGRLNVHPLSKKGRMSFGGEGYLAGGVEMVDFDVELGPKGRVAIAGEDGVIRVWQLGKEGVKGVAASPQQVLKGMGIDKITQIAFHPTAKDLLVGLTNDHGDSNIRFWDLSSGDEVKQVKVPAEGVFNMVWNPEGDRVAIATKDGRLTVFDPRDPATALSGKAHDSPRSFQTAWIDRTHLVTVGFSRGSQRKINLYRLPSGSGEIQTVSSLTIDVSPSVLFPVYDPDTSILYVWGKGERVIQAYEIRPEDQREPISKLPSYTAGTPQLGLVFLPKRMVDVKKVEVAKALRLTARTMEEVTFTIPRNKPEFFQDDIYQSTIDVESTVTTASEWLSGADTPPRRISLQPEGMKLLSQAPKVDSAAKKKFVPAANVMSEEEKKRQEMDKLFAKAKMDESSDEEEERSGIDPPDDDW